MFSKDLKSEIADAVQAILHLANSPELSKGEIKFLLHVRGIDEESWADIRNNLNCTDTPSFELIRQLNNEI